MTEAQSEASGSLGSAGEAPSTPASLEGALAVIVDSVLRLKEVQQRQQEQFSTFVAVLRGGDSGQQGIIDSASLERALASALHRAEQAEQLAGSLRVQLTQRQEQVADLQASLQGRDLDLAAMAERVERAEQRAQSLEVHFRTIHEQLDQLAQNASDRSAPAQSLSTPG